MTLVAREVSRQGPAVRRTVTDYVRSVCDLAQLVPGKSKAARQKAISTYATLVGAIVLARAVDDRALSQEILDAGLASSLKPDAGKRYALRIEAQTDVDSSLRKRSRSVYERSFTTILAIGADVRPENDGTSNLIDEPQIQMVAGLRERCSEPLDVDEFADKVLWSLVVQMRIVP